MFMLAMTAKLFSVGISKRAWLIINCKLVVVLNYYFMFNTQFKLLVFTGVVYQNQCESLFTA